MLSHVAARSRAGGFTIIEIMIGLGIAALLLALGLPAYKDFLANTKIRNAAESLQASLNVARSEAIKRNQQVQFLLFGDTNYNSTFVDSVTANSTGPNWLIRVPNTGLATFTHVDWKNGYEGSGQDDSAGLPATRITATYGAMALGGTANIITFKGLGGTLLGSTAVFDITNPTAGTCHTSSTPSPIRCLRVQVTVSGQVRMCDPSVGSTDTRYCAP